MLDPRKIGNDLGKKLPGKLHRNKYSRIGLILAFGLVAGTAQMCAPPPPEAISRGMTVEERRQRDRQCAIALSNAWEYYKNRDWDSSIRNYRNLVDLGCGNEYASDVYLYFGRAYQEVGKVDSAIWAFQQGLRYIPRNKDLLQNVAYTMGRQNRIDEQIRYMERWIEVDSVNTKAYGELAALLRGEERFDDLLHVLNDWDKIDPNNSRIQTEIIQVTELSGRDPLDVLRNRWLDNPDNYQYGYDYAAELVKRSEYTKAFRELEAVIQRFPSSVSAYELLAISALDNDDTDRAIAAYERLFALNRTNYRVAVDLSKTYLQTGEYEQALEWAETAMRASNSNGEAYYARAEVYYAVGDDCLGQRESGVARFDDKIVFMMAWEDYSTSVERGNRRGKARADFLEKNLIPSKGDWFLQPADIRVFKPQGSCYTWINRTVRRQ